MHGSGPDRLSQARRLVQSGALAEAGVLVRRALADQPASPQGLTLAGQIAVRASAPGEAVRHFGRAARVERPQDPRVLLNFARALQMAGRVREALSTAENAAAGFPDDPRPRAMIALLWLGLGQAEAAARALRPGDQRLIDPETAYRLGNRFATAGESQRGRAVALLERAVRAPGRLLPDALRDLLATAPSSYPRRFDVARRLLVLAPDCVDAMDAVAKGYADKRHPVRQAAWLWQSCCVKPGDLPRLGRAAEVTEKVKWPAHGIAANRLLLERMPNHIGIVNRICGLFTRDYGRSDDKPAAKQRALDWGRSMLEPMPKDPRIWDAVACMFKDVEAFAEAAELWPGIIRRFRDYEVLRYNYGLFLHERDYCEEAQRALKSSLVLKPDYVRAINLLSMAMAHVHDVGAALRYVRRGIMTSPGQPNCWLNYGSYLRAVGEYTKALEAFRQAEIHGGSSTHLTASARFNAGMSQITIGELQAGFKGIESRWATDGFPSPKRNFRNRIWRGPRLDPDSHLLVYMEQGLGDEVMASWYVPHLRKDVRRLVLDCDPRLVDIFKRTYEGVEVVPRSVAGHPSTRDPDITHKTPMLHVPQYYVPEVKFLIRQNWDWAERRGQRFPARLAVEEARLARWSGWLEERYPGRPRFGLSWRSKMRNRTRDQQYVSIEDLAAVLPEGCVAVNLQYSATEAETQELTELGRRRGFDFVTPEGVNLTDDLEDIFAILQVCDATVTPMISLAWMSGAVGCPTYVFRTSRERAIWQQFGTPFVPWAPSFRLFFRDPSEKWSVVVREMRVALQNCVSSGSGQG